MKSITVLLAMCVFLSPGLLTVSAQDDYRVLPIRGRLDISLVFIDVEPSWFGARTVDELVERISEGVRKTAKSVIYRMFESEQPPYAPFEFDISLYGIEFRLRPLEEFRLLLRSLNQPTPRELLEKEGIEVSLNSIHGPAALKMLVDLTEKYYAESLRDYSIFFICGLRALDDIPIYHSYGILPETGEVGGVLGLNMYGGPWWGRYIFVDLCALSLYDDYPPIQDLRTDGERLSLLRKYVDELIDLQFVKSTLYYPRYELQALVDIIIVDATREGLNFMQLVESFDVEMVEQALLTLTPYNLYNFKVRYLRASDVRGFAEIIKVYDDAAVFDAYKAYQLLERAGVFLKSEGGFQYIPSITVVTDYDTYVYLDDPEDTALGIALPDPEDSRYGKFAVSGASYYLLLYEGLAPTVAHEVAHVLGLSHPHDDFNEEEGEDVGSMIYTRSIETLMDYSTTWVETIKRRVMREGYYPVKTYWSIFDLDAMDRAIISVLLSKYEENYQYILTRLDEIGLRLESLQDLEASLILAKQLAQTAVEQFKRHNYFDRLGFRGLGAQLETSLDNAFLAMAVTELLKTYVEGLAAQNSRLQPQLEDLMKEISALNENIIRLRQEAAKTMDEISSLDDSIMRARQANEALKRRLEELSMEAAERDSLLAKKSDVDRRLAEEQKRLDQLSGELSGLRNTVMVMAAGVVAGGVAAGVIIIRFRKKTSPS